MKKKEKDWIDLKPELIEGAYGYVIDNAGIDTKDCTHPEVFRYERYETGKITASPYRCTQCGKQFTEPEEYEVPVIVKEFNRSRE